MVNGRLRSPSVRDRHIRLETAISERNFATKTALTNQIIGIGIARSRFGPADSWVIKNAKTAVSAVGR
jgi:hypothetical protein